MGKQAKIKTAANGAADDDSDSTAQARRKGRGSTAVYEYLREDILSLRIPPGSAIDEVMLAERFGLSRTPIREALLMLSGEDLVTFLPGRSAIVTPHTMSNAHEYMDTQMLLSRAIAKLAAEVRVQPALDEILRHQEAYERTSASSAIAVISAADLAFHRAVSFASGNEFLGKFYRLSLDYGRRMHLLHYYPIFDEIEHSACVDSHRHLVEAIIARDGDRAEKIAGEHVLAELRVVQRSLEPKVGARFALGPDARL
jgi:DNA-binding GntR family transcriptional regulator